MSNDHKNPEKNPKIDMSPLAPTRAVPIQKLEFDPRNPLDLPGMPMTTEISWHTQINRNSFTIYYLPEFRCYEVAVHYLKGGRDAIRIPEGFCLARPFPEHQLVCDVDPAVKDKLPKGMAA